MTALLLTTAAAFVVGAANISLVIFLADRLTSTSSAPVISAGEFAVVNDNAPASVTVKLAA